MRISTALKTHPGINALSVQNRQNVGFVTGAATPWLLGKSAIIAVFTPQPKRNTMLLFKSEPWFVFRRPCRESYLRCGKFPQCQIVFLVALSPPPFAPVPSLDGSRLSRWAGSLCGRRFQQTRRARYRPMELRWPGWPAILISLGTPLSTLTAAGLGSA